MEATELIKKVRKIEIKTRGLSQNIFAGEYHTAFKGRGMIFSEVREYQYGDDVRDISSIELIVVPGVAYDRCGNRVGRGKGFYDRLLASTHATKVGVGYDFQLVDDIDSEPHDVVMDLVVTEHEIIRVRRR